MKRRSYFLFMMRELTSVFVAGYCIFLLVMIYTLGRGDGIMGLLASPVSVVFHALALPFVLYHTITWFNLTPKILVLRIGEERVPPALIAGTFYAGWIIISLIVGWIVLAT
ncbi:MAG: fumarate reductase subunit C [Candidatus Neomarinimicrobiota bacterium]